MEDFALDNIIGKGPSARSLRLDLPRFTLIGATTRAGALAGPLRDRFGINCRLEYYSPAELQLIIERSADVLAVSVDRAGAREIAARSRGTPRVANRLLKRVRDFAQVDGDPLITAAVADRALARLQVDNLGLDNSDRKLLTALVKTFAGGPVGVETLATAVSEEVETVEDVYEPFLMQLGFVQRTARGRVAGPEAYRYLGLPYQSKPARAESPPLFADE
jgi:Holliday junction DNA helicase RuvB